MRGCLLLFVLLTTSCSPVRQAEETVVEPREIFAGRLTSLDGEPVQSMLRVRFFSEDGDEVPDRYFLDNECFDAGYFDQRHDVFLSGHSPKGIGMEESALADEFAERHRARCPEGDAANYTRFVDLMYAGGSLELDGDRARLTSGTSSSAEFVRIIELPIID